MYALVMTCEPRLQTKLAAWISEPGRNYIVESEVVVDAEVEVKVQARSPGTTYVEFVAHIILYCWQHWGGGGGGGE